MKLPLLFLSGIGLSGTLTAAIVTNNFVTNGPLNWTQQGGVTASQTTEAAGGAPGRAIDGNVSGAWANNSVTHTDPADLAPSWQVDLGAARSINDIRLWNRTD